VILDGDYDDRRRSPMRIVGHVASGRSFY